MFSSIEDWNASFAVPGVAEMAAGRGGLPVIRITSPEAEAEIYLHGAQVTSWKPAGAEEVLFLSERSRWEDGRAIRGGVPICFPWFRGKRDDPKAPAHGVVRTRSWQPGPLTHEQGAVTVSLSIASDEATRQWWPYSFRLTHRITVGETLKMELTVENTDEAPVRIEEALHTYHRVGDVSRARVSGLEDTVFLDNMEDNREKTQAGVVVFDRPTDSAYQGAARPLVLLDPVLGRQIRTVKENSVTTVVWNPWQQGAASLADLGEEEWRRMACVEAANILSHAVELAPGAQHTMTAILSVEREDAAE